MSAKLHRLKENQKGQSALEMAMIAPILLFIIIGGMDFAIGIYQYNTVSNVAREGARYAVTRDHQPLSASDLSAGAGNARSNAAAIQSATQKATALDQTRLTLTITPSADWVPRNTPGELVTATATYLYQPVTPFVPWSFNLTSRTTMVVE